jgi:inhibitor of nuclear factor kappa-B kinase subunit alpha
MDQTRDDIQQTFAFPTLPPSNAVRDAALAVLHNQNWSYRQIAHVFHCNHKTVREHLHPVEAFLGGVIYPKIPTQTADCDQDDSGLAEHFILFALLENPTRSVRKISDMMSKLGLPFGLGKTRVSELIHVLHIKIGYSIKRPRLTDKQLAKRNLFVHEITQDYRYQLPWFFSDECMIDLNPYRKRVYHLPGIKTAETIYQEYTKHPIHVMVWGGIAKNYKSPLLRVEGYINAEKYIQMLAESGVFETMDSAYGRERWVFQDDGAPPHRARVTKEFLGVRCHNLATGNLFCPANSPDLNPQGKLWAILRNGTDVEGCKNPEELFERLRNTWDNISLVTVNRLVETFSVSLAAVDALGGACINGHRDIINVLRTGKTTVDLLKESYRNEKRDITLFLEQSRRFFEDFRPIWEKRGSYKRLMHESYRIVGWLPEETLNTTKIVKRYPEWFRRVMGILSI